MTQDAFKYGTEIFLDSSQLPILLINVCTKQNVPTHVAAAARSRTDLTHEF